MPRLRPPGAATALTWYRDCGHGAATAVRFCDCVHLVPQLRSSGAATAVTTSRPHTSRQHGEYCARHRDSMNSPPTIVVVSHKPLGRIEQHKLHMVGAPDCGCSIHWPPRRDCSYPPRRDCGYSGDSRFALVTSCGEHSVSRGFPCSCDSHYA